jgi:hypothetical protein
VVLDLSTIHGASVARIFAGRLEAGTHAVPFAVDVPAGIYLLTVTHAGHRFTRTVRVL